MSLSERALDSSLFLRDLVLLYRLARAKYAELSGTGAAKRGGRWNQVGEEAIYTSCEAACTVLEVLGGIPKNVIPSNYALMRILLRGSWTRVGRLLVDQANQSHLAICATSSEAHEYYTSGSMLVDQPFALAVPSVLAPAWNVVLYPKNKGFRERITLESVDEYKWDPRQFTEEALRESSF